jgi:TolB-like protein/DNA-binding winged helix-turn-helix (wHTH) protein/Tfp pilus assembly protein PilF
MGRLNRSGDLVRFGSFELALRSGELRKAGLRVKIQEQPFRVLSLLLERPGELVTREELRGRIWPADTFVDFDQAVNVAVKKIRAALGDSAETPRFVETLPRRGYRFVAPVERLAAPVQAEDPPRPPGRRPSKRMLFWAALVVGASLAGYFALVRPRASGAPPGKVMLVVLPFADMSGAGGEDYFTDGLTEEMIVQLGRLQPRRLGVIARTSSMKYKNSGKGVHEIGRELNVDYVVEGSVRRAGDRVRIAVQLVQAGDQTQVWSDEYEGSLRDLLGIQRQVTQAIAHGIRLTLTRDEQVRFGASPFVDPEAYEAVIKGRFYWNKRTDEGMQKATDYFQEAVEEDPGYAAAYAGLADCWLSRAWYGYVSPGEAFPKAKMHALKALELDEHLAEAHTSLAFARLNYDWDWPAAGRSFQRAIDLNPNSANAHHWYGDYLSAMGRHQDAIAESGRARELDPLSSIINAWVGWRYHFAGRYDEAIVQYRRTLEMDPGFSPAHLVLGQAYEQKGLLREAVEELEKAQALSRGGPLYMSALAHAYARAGRRTEAEALLQRLRESAHSSYVPPYHVAVACTALDRKDEALNWLEKGYEERSAWMVWIKVDPRLDPLRPLPRFQRTLERMGFPRS